VELRGGMCVGVAEVWQERGVCVVGGAAGCA